MKWTLVIVITCIKEIYSMASSAVSLSASSAWCLSWRRLKCWQHSGFRCPSPWPLSMLELCINSLQGIHNKREQTTKVKKNHLNIFTPPNCPNSTPMQDHERIFHFNFPSHSRPFREASYDVINVLGSMANWTGPCFSSWVRHACARGAGACPPALH